MEALCQGSCLDPRRPAGRLPRRAKSHVEAMARTEGSGSLLPCQSNCAFVSRVFLSLHFLLLTTDYTPAHSTATVLYISPEPTRLQDNQSFATPSGPVISRAVIRNAGRRRNLIVHPLPTRTTGPNRR